MSNYMTGVDGVEVVFRTRSYPATILHCRETDSYDILYSDGTREYDASPSRVRQFTSWWSQLRRWVTRIVALLPKRHTPDEEVYILTPL